MTNRKWQNTKPVASSVGLYYCKIQREMEEEEKREGEKGGMWGSRIPTKWCNGKQTKY